MPLTILSPVQYY